MKESCSDEFGSWEEILWDKQGLSVAIARLSGIKGLCLSAGDNDREFAVARDR